MPQPTTNSWPFEVKEAPSADGHTGGVVAGVGIVEWETVGNKLADAGAPGVTVAGLVKARLLDGPEGPVPGNTEGVDAGAFSGFPLELDDNGAALIKPPEVLVLEDIIGAEEDDGEGAPMALIGREVLVLKESGPGEGDKGLVVPGRAGLEGTIGSKEVDAKVLMGLNMLGVLVPKDES